MYIKTKGIPRLNGERVYCGSRGAGAWVPPPLTG